MTFMTGMKIGEREAKFLKDILQVKKQNINGKKV